MSVKIFLTYCAKEDLVIYQADIISAYLHALLQHRRILMVQPTGLEKGKDSVYLLRKALYSFRESINLWNNVFDTKLQDLGFVPLDEDPCVY